MATKLTKAQQDAIDEARVQMHAKAKKEARELSAKTADHNETAKEALKMMRTLPKTDRQLAKFGAKTFLDDLIYISDGPRSGWFHHWDTIKWTKLEDRDFNADVSDAFEKFLEELKKGYGNLMTHFGIPFTAPTAKEGEGEDSVSEDAVASSIRAEYKKIESLHWSLQQEKFHGGLMKATRGAIHKSTFFFYDDSKWFAASDGWVLECNNLSAGWQAPDKSRPIARTSSVPHDGVDSDPELWQKYLDSIFKGAEGRAYQLYLQIAAGCSLLGRGDTRQIPSLYGEGGTGKSTFVRVLKDIFGGYGVKVGRDFLQQNARFSRARAKGARYVLLEETDKFEFADTGFIKELAGGGGTLSTEKKGVDAEEWPIQFVLFMATNHRINIDAGDNAAVERIDYVEFKHKFEVGASDFTKRIGSDLLEKCPRTILKWILEGAEKWDDGTYDAFPRPASMYEQDNEARKEQSSSIEWLDIALSGTIGEANGESYCLVRAENPNEPVNNCVKNIDAYNHYRWWALSQGYEKIDSNKKFYDHVKSYLKTTIVKSGDSRYIKGLKYGSTQESAYFQGQVMGKGSYEGN